MSGKNIKVVIGANWGDEGKGLMTDYFASKTKKGIVVRFNGGSQAGHTVVTPDSVRHIFSHFGAGTLAGLPTYLSKFFIVNPMTFRKEFEGLKEKGLNPKVFIDKDALVSTPYDMMINQIVEMSRGSNKHGSCGIGIWETIKRSEIDSLKLKFLNLTNINVLKLILYNIKDYTIKRLKELGIKAIPWEYLDLISNDKVIENYIKDIEYLLDNATINNYGKNLLIDFDDIIFEGGQGLLLDQDNIDFFPNLTPSSTGMKNVAEIIKDAGLEKENIEICYVTRCYVTRHGAGNLPNEILNKPHKGVVDLTNVPNQYQGKLRYGLLSVDFLAETIKNDLKHAKGLNYKTKIAITCLDQIDNNELRFIASGKQHKSLINGLVYSIINKTDIKDFYMSFGMTRDTIKEM